jgi:hypothetical protein
MLASTLPLYLIIVAVAIHPAVAPDMGIHLKRAGDGGDRRLAGALHRHQLWLAAVHGARPSG